MKSLLCWWSAALMMHLSTVACKHREGDTQSEVQKALNHSNGSGRELIMTCSLGEQATLEVYLSQTSGIHRTALPRYQISLERTQFGEKKGSVGDFKFETLEVMNNGVVRFLDDHLSGNNVFQWNSQRKTASLGISSRSSQLEPPSISETMNFSYCEPKGNQSLEERSWDICSTLKYIGQGAKCKPKCIENGRERNLNEAVGSRTCKIGPKGPRME